MAGLFGEGAGAGEPDLEDAVELLDRRGGERRGADAARHHEVDGVAGALFIVKRLAIHLPGVRLEGEREAVRREEAGDALGDVLGAELGGHACAGDGDHPDAYAGAVPQAVPLGGLDAMSDAVAEVEQLAQAALALVLLHHRALDVDVARDEPGDAGEVAPEQVRRERGALELLEELRIGDDRVLDDLAAAVGELLVAERAQAADVGDDGARLPKGAGEVLAVLKVDGGFAAHRGVDHGEKRGGDLHVGDAAHVRGGREARHIAHDAPAERDDDVVAREVLMRGALQDE